MIQKCTARWFLLQMFLQWSHIPIGAEHFSRVGRQKRTHARFPVRAHLRGFESSEQLMRESISRTSPDPRKSQCLCVLKTQMSRSSFFFASNFKQQWTNQRSQFLWFSNTHMGISSFSSPRTLKSNERPKRKNRQKEEGGKSKALETREGIWSTKARYTHGCEPNIKTCAELATKNLQKIEFLA